MNLKHKEHDLTEITDFHNKILVYAGLTGFVPQGLRAFLSIWRGLIISSYIESIKRAYKETNE